MGWSVPMAAEAQGCSAATGYKWLRRFRAEGPLGLWDRSSRPDRSPMRLSPAREQAIVTRRQRTLEGPHRIGWALGEAPATVHRVLQRRGVPRLRDLDRPTRTVVRYERERPGELLHVDVKKLGRIPLGGGWRIHGRANVPGSKRHRGDGYDFIHAAVDDRSRLAYAGVAHRRTRPYRPQTNGKVERFNLSLKWEWAYARPYETNASRTEQLAAWVHRYNYHRPHMALAGRAPITAVNNVPRK